ncbi:hypothetical protein HHI36_005539 [Cryptolaemus montrouzieri]|uniref:Glycolipid transfer protein domain-containing protein n=1 Tax=Cryptolaemus montrouzieri TaxID=559131 RepID=A0ABD2NUC1_9CUCU
MEAAESTYFDLRNVRENLQEAKLDNDDVDLQSYLKCFNELNKFFTLIGNIFGFVSSELEGKIQILKDFLNKPDEAHNFLTVKKMIDFEKEHNLLQKDNYISGSRTLLRIHRALEFIQAFLKAINGLKEDEGTSGPCIDAYNCTLGNHHPFFIRTGAKLAMYTLPIKHELMLRVCGSEDEIQKAEEILPETLDICSEIYDRIQRIYSERNLLSLP